MLGSRGHVQASIAGLCVRPALCLTLCPPRPQALLKMDCQGLVVRLLQDFVLLTTAVEVAQRWRELAEKLAKVSKQQMDAYESPHRDRNGVVDSEVSGVGQQQLLPGVFVRTERVTGPWESTCAARSGLARRGPGGRPLLLGVSTWDTRSDAAKAAPHDTGRCRGKWGESAERPVPSRPRRRIPLVTPSHTGPEPPRSALLRCRPGPAPILCLLARFRRSR